MVTVFNDGNFMGKNWSGTQKPECSMVGEHSCSDLVTSDRNSVFTSSGLRTPARTICRLVCDWALCRRYYERYPGCRAHQNHVALHEIFSAGKNRSPSHNIKQHPAMVGAQDERTFSRVCSR